MAKQQHILNRTKRYDQFALAVSNTPNYSTLSHRAHLCANHDAFQNNSV